MARQRHEIPTHLNVADKAFYGLSVRQAMYLITGFSGAFGLWSQWPDVPTAVRIALAAFCLLSATALAVIRPGGRGIEEWAFVALRYLALPKVCLWRPRDPDLAVWRSAEARWAELAPQVTWQEERR